MTSVQWIIGGTHRIPDVQNREVTLERRDQGIQESGFHPDEQQRGSRGQTPGRQDGAGGCRIPEGQSIIVLTFRTWIRKWKSRETEPSVSRFNNQLRKDTYLPAQQRVAPLTWIYNNTVLYYCFLWNSKVFAPWKKSYDKPRQCITK